MNYATALTLPDWAAEAQMYSKRMIHYTPIVLKAFNKTFAPVILDSLKGVGLHLIQRERLWCQWALNVAGITHNPLQSAVRAAHAELTSAEAQATYNRVRYITRESAMATISIAVYGVVAVSVGIETAQKVYHTAKRCYDWVDARLNPPLPEPIILPSVDSFFEHIKAQEEIALLIEAVRYDRSFLKQLDRLDTEALALVCAKVDETIAQARAGQLKSDRAALALQTEGDRLAKEALAYVVDRAVELAAPQQPTVLEVPVVDAATVLNVPGATGGKQRKPRTKAGTGKAAADKPKGASARAGAK